jgi:hypothetical protein
MWSLALIVAALVGVGIARQVEKDNAPIPRERLDPFAPPLPPINSIRPLTPEQAADANKVIPASTEPIEPARPFLLPPTVAGELSRGTALDCLTAAVYYEAASESFEGQRAVAQVVLNRVRHPAFPKSVCGVVYQGSERATGCQFTFTCDGSRMRQPTRTGWNRAAAVAAAALNGVVEPSVGTATHYHTVWVLPYWADSLTKLTTIGAHIFYRWPGHWGKLAAFSGRYVGESREPELAGPEPLTGGLTTAVADPLAAAAAPIGRLLADESKGNLALPRGEAPARVVADGVAGQPLADERRGILRADDPQADSARHPFP